MLLALIFVGLTSCTNKNKSKEIASYSYSSETKLNKILDDKIGSWIDKGTVCYGVLVMNNENGDVVNCKPIKAKVILITEDGIKMKALESVSLAPKEGCSKLGLDKGDTWWEKEGDLFREESEAIAFLKMLPKAKATKRTKHFTID